MYEETIVEYFSKLTGAHELDYSINIFETGMVDSLAVLKMIAFLEKTFKIKISLDDLEINNFSSVNAVLKLLEGKLTANA